MAIDLGEDDALAEAGSATVATKWTTKVAEIISRAFHSETNSFGSAALFDTGSAVGNIPTLNANGKIPQARVRIPEQDYTADGFKDYGIQGIDFIAESLTFKEVANGAIPYTAFNIKGTPTEGARIIYNFEDGTLNWDIYEPNIVGEIQYFVHSSAVDGWLPCDGRSLSRTTYAKLFGVLSTTYGNVDGDTFNLPDLRGRVVAGKGTTDAFSSIGKIGGTETHELTEDEIPRHGHLVARNTTLAGAVSDDPLGDNYLAYRFARVNNTAYYLKGQSAVPNIGKTSDTGGDTAHTNLQPYIVQEYRIFAG